MQPFEINLVPTKKSYIHIIESFLNSITNEDYTYGMRLSNEADLLKVMNVSRPTLREALRILEFLGFITISPRNGMHVATPDTQETYFSLVYSMLFDKITDRELFEFRRALMVEAAGLATLNRSAEDLKILSSLLEDMKANMDSDAAVFAELDNQFHDQVTRCSHNRVLIKMSDTVSLLVQGILHHSHRNFLPNRRNIIVDYHSQIYQHLCDQNEVACRQAMTEHLAGMYGNIEGKPLPCRLASHPKIAADSTLCFSAPLSPEDSPN